MLAFRHANDLVPKIASVRDSFGKGYSCTGRLIEVSDTTDRFKGMLGGLPGWTGSAGGGWSFNPISGQFEMREGDDTGAYGHQMNAISSILNQMMGTGANIYGTQAGFLGNLYNTAMSPVLAEIAQTPHLLAQQRFDTAFPAVFGSMGDYFSKSQGFGNAGGIAPPQWDPAQNQFPDRPQAPTMPASPFQGLPVA